MTLPRSVISKTEINTEEHPWWHNLVPNYGVYYDRKKTSTGFYTEYRCKLCNWKKIVIQEFVYEKDK